MTTDDLVMQGAKAQTAIILTCFGLAVPLLVQSNVVITWSNFVRHLITGTKAEYQSDVGSTKHIPYLGLMGKLWGVFCEYLRENWLRYNGTTLY